MLRIAVRPQEREKRLAPMVSARYGDGEPGEHRLTLGLREDGVHDPAVGVEKFETPKHLEFDHLGAIPNSAELRQTRRQHYAPREGRAT